MTTIQAEIPTITTERLVLRETRPSDVPALMAMSADPLFTEFIGGPSEPNEARAWLMIARQWGMWCLRGHGMWAITLRSTGEMIGRTGLWWEPGWPGLEAAYFIASAHWGNGYATEAAREAVRFGFEVCGAEAVVSVIRPDNRRSLRVAEKLGERFWREERLHGAVKHVYRVERGAWGR